MPSTYSPSLRLELIATGEQSGTWGDTTNSNLGTLIEQAVAGYESIAMSDANITLTATNGTADQSRNAVIKLTGTLSASRNVVVPTAEKTYWIWNGSTGGFGLVVKTSAGTGVTIAAGNLQAVFCDGTNVLPLGLPFDTSASALPLANGGTGATTASGARTNLGLGTIATQDASNVLISGGAISGITDLAVADGGTGASTASSARVNLLPSYGGNGSKVLALNSGASDVEWVTAAAGSVTSVAVSGGSTGLTTSGGPVTSSGTITIAGTLAVANGGTGSGTASGALSNLGGLALSGGTLTGPTVVSTNSASDALRITQTGAGNALVVEDSANPDSSPFVVDANGNVGIGTNSPAVRLAVVSTDAMLVPVGTTAQRPTGATGYFRYNSTTSSFEGHNGTNWGSIGGSSAPSYTVRSSNYTAVAGDYILANTSSGSITITLPASPATGSIIQIADSQGTFLTNPLTVARNGNTIMQRPDDLRASTNGAQFGLVYNGSDWRII